MQSADDLRAVSLNMRNAEQSIKAQYGTESDQYYAFLVAAQANENLIDTIPGLREAILKEIWREAILKEI